MRLKVEKDVNDILVVTKTTGDHVNHPETKKTFGINEEVKKTIEELFSERDLMKPAQIITNLNRLGKLNAVIADNIPTGVQLNNFLKTLRNKYLGKSTMTEGKYYIIFLFFLLISFILLVNNILIILLSYSNGIENRYYCLSLFYSNQFYYIL